MTGKEALEIIFKEFKSEPTVVATGYICRTTQAACPGFRNFYMIGSMGMASSIGLGLALAQPKKNIVVIDGDGAMLMNMGNVASVGTLKPKNFIHLVLDNAAYESTGGQPSHTQIIALEKIAKAGGYVISERASTPKDLAKKIKKIAGSQGPSFLLIKVTQDHGPASPRVTSSPEEITREFSKVAQK